MDAFDIIRRLTHERRFVDDSNLVLLLGLALSLIFYFLYRACFKDIKRALFGSLLAYILGQSLCLANFMHKYQTDLLDIRHSSSKYFNTIGGTRVFNPRFWDDLLLQSLWVFLAVTFALPLVVTAYGAWRKAQSTVVDWRAEIVDGRGWRLFWIGGTALAVGSLVFGHLVFGCIFAFFMVLIEGGVTIFLRAWLPSGDEAAYAATRHLPDEKDLAAERGRVLKLLEEGKINAEECGELLTALSESARHRAAPRPLGRARKMAIGGAMLVLAGFFLPWFAIDLNQVMSQMTGQMGTLMNAMPIQQNMPPGMRLENAPNLPANVSFKFGGMNLSDGVLRIAGGNVPYGLGWAVLLLAAIVAFAPLESLWPHPVLRRKIALLLLGIGAFLLLYLLTQNFRFASFGLLVVFSGYTLELAGVLQSRRDDELR